VLKQSYIVVMDVANGPQNLGAIIA